MKELIDKVFLKNRDTNLYEDAELYRGIDENNLAHIEGRWRPIFETRRSLAVQSGKSMSDINAEDAHWNWGQKALAAIDDPFLYDLFVLECGGNTQALMMTRKGGIDCFSRHPEHERSPILYIEFLATAPWNRRVLVPNPTYKGCGITLFGAAISLSIEEEMGGRIGLHSLPGAEEFYRDSIGMTDLGNDEEERHQGLRYFELPTSAVHNFLEPTN